MITLILTLATMAIVGVHVHEHDKPSDNIQVQQTTIIKYRPSIVYDSPKVDRSLLKD